MKPCMSNCSQTSIELLTLGTHIHSILQDMVQEVAQLDVSFWSPYSDSPHLDVSTQGFDVI